MNAAVDPRPGLDLTRVRIAGRGEICLACSRPIKGLGERITYATMTTHAHWNCLKRAIRLLGYSA